MKRVLPATLVILAASISAWGADYYAGLAAFKAGDYDTAIEEWKPLADAGFPEAQYQLARMYHRGYAVQDDDEAVRLYRLAADQDHNMAQNNLGVMYEQGRGVERDDALAAAWYLKAAKQGLVVAQANLAVLYEEGRGVPADGTAAAQWYRLAGDAGHANSQYRLARQFDSGNGVERSDNKAADWYRKAAKQDHAEAQLALARMYEEGRGVKQDSSKAAKWRRLASMQGLDVSPADRGGEAADLSPAQAETVVETPSSGAEPDTVSPESAVVASSTASADGVEGGNDGGNLVESPRNSTPAEVAQAAVVPPAPAPLPPPPDEHLAPALAATFAAAEAGDVDAQYDLARRFENGNGLPHSPKEAGKWYLAAAERGHGVSGYKLAFQYFRGRGIAKGKDLLQAHFWFSISAERGVGDAAVWRDRIGQKLSKRQLAQSEKMLEEWNRP